MTSQEFIFSTDEIMKQQDEKQEPDSIEKIS